MPGKILRLLARSLSTRKRKDRTAKPVKPSHATELWYRASLGALTKMVAAGVNANVIPLLTGAAPTNAAALAQLERAVNAELDALAASFGNLDAVADRLAAEAVEKNLRAVDASIERNLKSAVGIDVGGLMQMDQKLAVAMREANTANVALIKDIPDKYLLRVRDIVDKNVSGGMRFEGIIAEIQAEAGIGERRAALIARDQTSKMNGAFNEARQTSLGISKYRWQTSGDERVRESHAENDGQVFEWGNPPPDTGHPGEDINCRCVAVPVFDLD